MPLQLGPRGEKINICKIGWAAQNVGFETHIHQKKTKKQNKTKQKQQKQQLQGAPSLKCSSYDYPFKKVLLSNTFFIVWLQNSHNDYDAFQKLMKSELFGCLLYWGRRGGGDFLYVSYTRICHPIWWILHRKSVNMGPIMTPKKSRNMGGKSTDLGKFVINYIFYNNGPMHCLASARG